VVFRGGGGWGGVFWGAGGGVVGLVGGFGERTHAPSLRPSYISKES